MSPTHYEELGIEPDASRDEVREAYRTLARRHHPDRARSGDDRMGRINEAYRVLRDPARRAVYDASLRNAQPVVDAAPQPAVPDRLPMPNMPWRTIVVAGIVAIIAVVAFGPFAEPAGAPRPDGLIAVGECVALADNGDAYETPCAASEPATSDAATPSEDLVVRQFVSFGEVCDFGYEPHRDRQGLGIACIERVTIEAGE